MVRGNPISNKELKSAKNSYQRDQILKRFNFTEQELRNIRKYNQIKGIEIAGKKLYEKTGTVKSLTNVNLSAVFSNTWSEYSWQKARKVLKRKYKDKKLKIGGLKLNLTYFLRKDIGCYEGNLENAVKKWHLIENSNEDLLQSIKIPLEIGKLESQLLGVIWGDANIKATNGYVLQFTGKKDDFPFYDNWLKNTIKEVFNYDVKIIKNCNDPTKRDKKQFTTKYYNPVINISSKVIITWIQKHVGFVYEKSKLNLKLPKCDYDGFNFLEGIIASMGSLSVDRRIISFSDKDIKFIDRIQKLVQEYLFSGKNYDSLSGIGNKDRRMLSINPTELKLMDLINPKHYSGFYRI